MQKPFCMPMILSQSIAHLPGKHGKTHQIRYNYLVAYFKIKKSLFDTSNSD